MPVKTGVFFFFSLYRYMYIYKYSIQRLADIQWPRPCGHRSDVGDLYFTRTRISTTANYNKYQLTRGDDTPTATTNPRLLLILLLLLSSFSILSFLTFVSLCLSSILIFLFLIVVFLFLFLFCVRRDGTGKTIEGIAYIHTYR